MSFRFPVFLSREERRPARRSYRDGEKAVYGPATFVSGDDAKVLFQRACTLRNNPLHEASFDYGLIGYPGLFPNF
jgi:hypothetical protein